MQWANQEGSVSWTVNIPETGVYNIKMIYEALESNTNDVEFSLLIDGESPYATASRITLSKRWINESEIKQDSRQNDIRPGQISTPCWQETPLEDIDGLFNEPLEFYMEAGEHTITFESEKAEFAVKSFTFYQYEAPAAYTAPSDSVKLLPTSHQELFILQQIRALISHRAQTAQALLKQDIILSVQEAGRSQLRQ